MTPSHGSGPVRRFGLARERLAPTLTRQGSGDIWRTLTDKAVPYPDAA